MTDGNDGRIGRGGHPVFRLLADDGRNLLWLSRQIGFSHQHVRNVKAGQHPPSARFRRECARVMGRSESDLFASDHGASGSSRREDAPADGSDTQDDGTALGHTAYAAAGGVG